MFRRKTNHSIKKNNSLMRIIVMEMLLSIKSIRKVAMEIIVALLMRLLMQFHNFFQPSNICFRNSNLLQLRSGTCWSPNLRRKPSLGLLLTK
ncbi:hypothetical protein HanXRQr2_Chr13g0597781 [Helianthus annuus]|uniref:Uncharacterized protein n=1 Tax=Helianthus annuus TaxID=4232 RepID=A0A9K3EJE0_HELAN|nr:hypothetical protein HanXRQr2_Chr13g0597781 [Helianthus annuus]KAJ0850029.1 hypothetical protein HanPSC8_Chr13g0575851 [Helianthus annuus]